MSETRPVLYLIVCAAGSAAEAAEGVRLAQARGWDVCVVLTPAAVEFVDPAALAEITGHPVCSDYRRPWEARRLPDPRAVVAAPATYNTVNKWAHGTADTYALGLLAEFGPVVPTAVVPVANASLAANPVFGQSLAYLRRMGVEVIGDPRAAGERALPWDLALDAVDRARPADPATGT